MNLKVTSIHNHGNAAEEYVLLSVLADCDLVYYALADTTYNANDTISNKLRHHYWWVSKQVKRGELVVLRTGIGTDDSYNNSAGNKVHRFFWGLKSAVWNNSGDAAVLFHLNTWNTTKAK